MYDESLGNGKTTLKFSFIYTEHENPKNVKSNKKPFVDFI